MLRFQSLVTLVTCLFIASCGGGSGSSSSPSDKSNQSQASDSKLCPTGDTFEINGIELTLAVFDRNKDGCLSDFEYRVATRAAEQIAKNNATRIEVTGTNGNNSLSKINSMRVTGNAEVSDGKAQLHTNMEQGNFNISLKVDSNSRSLEGRSSDERLKLYFDDEPIKREVLKDPLFALTKFSFPLPPMRGDISYVFGCKYLTSLAVKCDTLAVTETNNVGARIMTLKINVTFPLALTFDTQSLPQSGFIMATFCSDKDDIQTCLDNYAEVPVSFN